MHPLSLQLAVALLPPSRSHRVGMEGRHSVDQPHVEVRPAELRPARLRSAELRVPQLRRPKLHKLSAQLTCSGRMERHLHRVRQDLNLDAS